MTTKEFLSLYRQTENLIIEMNYRLISLRSKAEQITPPYGGNIGASNPSPANDRIPMMVEAIAQEKERMEKYISETAELRRDIENAIFSIQNSTYSTLLIAKYINGKTWEQIAALMNYSYVHVVHRLHPEALKAVKIPEKYENMKYNET